MGGGQNSNIAEDSLQNYLHPPWFRPGSALCPPSALCVWPRTLSKKHLHPPWFRPGSVVLAYVWPNTLCRKHSHPPWFRLRSIIPPYVWRVSERRDWARSSERSRVRVGGSSVVQFRPGTSAKVHCLTDCTVCQTMLFADESSPSGSRQRKRRDICARIMLQSVVTGHQRVLYDDLF